MMKPEDVVAKITAVAQTLEFTHPKFGAVKRWIVEGDVGLSERDLLPYAKERIEIAERVKGNPAEKKHGLIAIEVGGKILRWKRDKVLDYCVWRPSFKKQNEYQAAVRDMAFAAADWSAICGITFRHVQDKDTDENLALGDVTFPVVRQEGGGSTVAMAFFPNSPVEERIVWIFDGHVASNPAFNPVGVLRHELGHVLGFRHEHIAPEAPDYFQPEPTDHIIRLTDYDPKSVMHYVANEVGDSDLRFTDLDKQGATAVYGAPDSRYTLVD